MILRTRFGAWKCAYCYKTYKQIGMFKSWYFKHHNKYHKGKQPSVKWVKWVKK